MAFTGPGTLGRSTVRGAVFNAPNFGLITTAKQTRFMQLVARFDF